MQSELKDGASIKALKRFNAALLSLSASNFQPRITPVLSELCYNLESFNPAFASVVLAVQKSIGHSDYLRRDAALKQLIVPLAGEYGMHNSEAQSALLENSAPGVCHRQQCVSRLIDVCLYENTTLPWLCVSQEDT